MPSWLFISISFFIILLRGLLGAAETGLYGISDLRVQELLQLFPKPGKRLWLYKVNREKTASSIRLGMVFANVLASFCAAFVALRHASTSALYLETLFAPNHPTPPWLFENMDWILGATAALATALFATAVETSLRAAAMAKPETWAKALSGLIRATSLLLSPFVLVVAGPLNALLQPMGLRASFEAPPLPLEDLEKLLAAQAAKNEVDKVAPELIHSIFELSDKRCRDVMVPRTDVVSVNLHAPTPEILRALSSQNHSRMPVLGDDEESILGILHVRDLLPLVGTPENIVLQEMIRPAVYVPWFKPIGDLLRDMQKQRIHMAIVVDEYGSFIGIVTLEDILREIVGDIGDEFEKDEKSIEKIHDGSFLVDATLSPEEFTKYFGVALPSGDFETLGGYLSWTAGALPEIGDKFTLAHLHLVVHSKDGPRLERIRIVRPKGASFANLAPAAPPPA
ncbi:MAG: hemolysin family protein [Proteobacteria bacterium]|nr:hemolysin family protein [Cystobacterineae bacterium]MCL2259376.1 hemolysin family protein [Cystobacterineae bacterium]MCL2314171.1 hemolysin family protein [Pseudomonadota bacterium]